MVKKRVPWNTGKKLSKEHREKLSFSKTLDGYISRLGVEEGTKAYYEKNKNLSVGVESLKKRGYSDDEIERIRNKHAEKSKITKENMILKYGEEKGIERYNTWKKKQRKNSKRSIEYWLKEFNGNKKLAKEALSNYQSRNKDFFIERYGEIDGMIKYQSHVESITKSFQNRTFNNSKTEIKIGEIIKKHTNKKVINHPHRYYIYLDNDAQKMLKQNFIIPDIVIPEANIIIEYFGDYWHCSEKMFKDDTYIHPYIKKTVGDIRKKDRLKKEFLEKLGWKVIIIWASEYDDDKMEEVLNEINK